MVPQTGSRIGLLIVVGEEVEQEEVKRTIEKHGNDHSEGFAVNIGFQHGPMSLISDHEFCTKHCGFFSVYHLCPYLFR